MGFYPSILQGYSTFAGTKAIPTEMIAIDKIVAKFNDGILVIDLFKTTLDKENSKKIKIN